MSSTQPEPVAPLVEHFFRHEAGRLVSVLTRIFGWRHFDLVEDMVQATLADALQAWRVCVPDNPSAWVHRVAKNKVLDALRRDKIGRRVLSEWAAGRPTHDEGLDQLFLDSEMEDSQLRMIFACCHPHLARENQLALTLKALCGFSNAEIARALLVGEETIKKRLQRATRDLIGRQVALEPPAAGELVSRLDSVHQVLYLLFNEGYSSSEGETAIRADLCEEAARLCHLLCSHPRCSTPSTHALMALMLFHAARLEARLDDRGFILLMEEQDRSQWDQRLIRRAQEFLNQSAEGTVISSFHLEAAIAYHHCTAKSCADTDWRAILRLYDALLTIHRSPVYLLNRAIVVAQIEGPHAGIRALDEARQDSALRHYYFLDATLGELYRRAGDLVRARQHLKAAREKTRSPFDRELIDRRLAKCLDELEAVATAKQPSLTLPARRRTVEWLLLVLRFREQLAHGFVQLFVFICAYEFITDHAFGIENIDRRKGLDVPALDDVSFWTIPPMDPGHVRAFEELLERVLFLVSADADESKRGILVLFDHLAFMRNHALAGSAPGRPHVQHHHFAFVILKLDLFAVEILALDVGRRFADREMTDFKERAFDLFA
jgi:RNA polymerase sigma factor (sigma-70 family)